MPSITVPLAFAAGLLSFISPCVLPLVPVYLSYLSGTSISSDTAPSRRLVFSQALLFVGGFTLVFVVLFGLPATFLGSALKQYDAWIAKIGGTVVILFGLHTMGVVTIPFLNMTRRSEAAIAMEPGHVRSVLFGMTFAAAWTPCIGPLLGTVMTLALTQPSRAVGFVLIYAAGLAVPFLITAALLARAVSWLKRLNRHMRAVELASGLFMVFIGTLLLTGLFTTMNSYFIRITPDWLLRFL